MRTRLGGVLGKIPIPTPAMLVALSALFIAASGTAVAAISFTASDGTITACRDNKTGVLRAIQSGQSCSSKETTITWKDGITGKVADSDKLDGQDASAFLGATQKATDAAHADRAGDANTLDGKNSTDFVSGTGSMTTVDEGFSDPDGPGGDTGFSSVLTVPGAQIQAACMAQAFSGRGGMQISVSPTNDVLSSLSLWRDDGGADPIPRTLYPGPSDPTAEMPTDTDSSPVSQTDHVIWQGSSSAGTFTAVLFTRYDGRACNVSGYVLSAQKAPPPDSGDGGGFEVPGGA